MPSFAFSLFRLYIFLFFDAAYVFITFWITTTFYLFPPFALFGAILFLFVLVMQITVTEAIRRSNAPTPPVGFGMVIIPMILFVLGYVQGVDFMQNLVIQNLRVPAESFVVTSRVLTGVSAVISFHLSFIKKQVPTNPRG